MKHYAYPILAGLIAALLTAEIAAAPPSKALVHAHAHNDYYHKRPLTDALERGFASIEADVFLVDGKLLVGHYRHELRPERTLQSLYLDPLARRVEQNNGRVFAGDEQLTLLVDLKTDGAAAYAVLDELLHRYDSLLKGRDRTLTSGAVAVVVTGNRPIEAIRHADRRVAIDGRLADVSEQVPAELIPLVSENWASHFDWRGNGPMPDEQRQRLADMVQTVHSQQRRLRFWGTPDKSAVWTELRSAGVDLIGADDLDALQQFLRDDAD